jgi:hypothetical protein
MFTKTIQLIENCVTIFISAGNKLIKETMKTAQLSLHNLALQSKPTSRCRYSIVSETVAETRKVINGKATQVIERPETCPGAQVFIGTAMNGKPTAKMYAGKSCKPTSNYYYHTEAQMMKAIEDFFAGLERTAEVKATRKNAERIARSIGHGWEVGDILNGSWGYEQTNQEFCKVVATTQNSVTIVEIGSVTVESTGYASSRVKADPDNIISEPRTIRVRSTPYGNYAKLHNSCTVSKMEDPTESRYESHYA